MGLTLSDEARRHVAAFADLTGATATDCLLRDDGTVAFVVARGEMAAAVGPDGAHVERLEDELGADVELIEDADTAADFVANALAPAAVRHVTISENDDTVAYVEVAEADRGVAIGTDGRRIELARDLAARHFGIDDVALT